MRKILLASLAFGCTMAASLPASAQVWGGVGFRVGHTPVGISVGAPAPVYPAPYYAAPVYVGPVYPAPAYVPPPVFINGYWRSPVWVGRPGYWHGRYYSHGYWRH